MKLHRSRRVLRERHPLPRILAWAVGSLAVVALGFFGAKYFTEHPLKTDSVNSSSPMSSASSDIPASTDNPSQSQPIVSADSVRAFYLPLSAMSDATALTNTLKQAAAAGFNSVVFDLKDSSGTLYYRSQTARAAQVNSFAVKALSIADTQALFTSIRTAGLQPIPRLYAFMDNAAARALPTARISHQSNSSWVWYDANPSKGGRAWLNPYADEAQLYVIELAKELRDAGAAAILLDGVQFPTQLSAANFGNNANTSMERDEILTAFIHKARTLLGDGCPLMLSCTSASALGTNTVVYGGNPLTFAPAVASPML